MVFKTSYSIRAGNTAAALTANLTLTLKKEKKTSMASLFLYPLLLLQIVIRTC